MAIEIREYVGAESIHFRQAESTKTKVNLTEWHVQDMIDENSLMVDIEGICSKLTRNFTYYEPQCLKDSVPNWTSPYERPVIMHHNEKDSVIIGRIKAVEYTDKQTRSGTPALVFTVNIPDEAGKKGVKNGTLSTVSIGAIAHDVRCSVCGTNLAEYGLCEHEKGETYDDKLCYWIIKKMEPKELSYVIVPSDIYAHNLRVYKPQEAAKAQPKEIGESTNQSEVKKEMYNENPFADIEIAESANEPISSVKEAEATPTPKEEPAKPVKIDEEIVAEEKGEIKEDGEKPKEEPKEEAPVEEKPEEKPEEPKEDEKSTEEELKELKVAIADLQKTIASLHKKLDAEKKLRESAETELLTFRVERKTVLAEQINTLRADLNLQPEEVNSLVESSEESLGLSLKTLKEFKEANKNILNIPKIQSNVATSEDVDNTSKITKEVKEALQDSNIDLVEQYVSIFKNLI